MAGRWSFTADSSKRASLMPIDDHDACCIVAACSDSGCRVVLPKGSRCLSGSKYQAAHGASSKCCDCLVFVGEGAGRSAYAVELKRGQVGASECLEQLQAGLDRISEIAPEVRSFAAVVAHGGSVRSMEIQVLRLRRVRLGNVSAIVQIVRCGTELAAVDCVSPPNGRRARRPL